MHLHEVKIGDLVTFKQKGGKSMKGKVIHRHDGKDRPHLANYVNIQPEDKSAYPKTIHVSQIKPFITEDVSMEHISENIDALVNSIQTDSSVDAIDAFNMAMQEKINDILEVAKETVASSMFNTEECEDCNEEVEGLEEGNAANKAKKNAAVQKMAVRQIKDFALHSAKHYAAGKYYSPIMVGHVLQQGIEDSNNKKETLKHGRRMLKYGHPVKEELEGLEEKLSGKQYKLDANHNGKLDSKDFKMLRHEKESAQGEKKIAKYRKMTSEEVESLDELKQSTYQSYHDKALTQKSRGKGLYAATKILRKHKETEAAKMASAKTEYSQGEVQGLNTKKGIKQASRKVFKNTQVVHDPNTGETRFHGDQYENFSLEEMMTRKHFQQVADVIKSHEDPMKRHELAHHHSEIFTKSNPHFDLNRFFAAANASHEKPMKEDYEQMDEYTLWRTQENGFKANGHEYAPGRGPKKKKNTDSKVNLEKPSSKRRPAGTIKPKAPAKKTEYEINLAAHMLADKAKKDLNNSYEMDGYYVNEVINKSTPTSDVIDDFVNSTNPKFVGKSKKERIRMALGAKYAMMRKEDFESLDELKHSTYYNAAEKRVAQADNVAKMGDSGIAPEQKLRNKAVNLNVWAHMGEKQKQIRAIKNSLSSATKRKLGMHETVEEVESLDELNQQTYFNAAEKRVAQADNVAKIGHSGIAPEKKLRNRAARLNLWGHMGEKEKENRAIKKSLSPATKRAIGMRAEARAWESIEQIDERTIAKKTAYLKSLRQRILANKGK